MEKIPNIENSIKIISFLEKDIFQDISMHQFSMQVNLDYKTIRKTVQILSQLNILKKEIKGKAYLISLNLSHYDIKTYLGFASYYNRLTYFLKVSQFAYLFEDVKKLGLGHSCLVLFGSYVLDRQTKSSDIDLLLITESKAAASRIKSLLLNYDLKTDLNILSFEQYQKALASRDFNLANQVLSKHIVLKNPELYWELTLQGLKDGNRY